MCALDFCARQDAKRKSAVSAIPQRSEARRVPRSGVIIRVMVLGTFDISKVPRPQVREPAMNYATKSHSIKNWISAYAGMTKKQDGFQLSLE
jgi:hypothetical protein